MTDAAALPLTGAEPMPTTTEQRVRWTCPQCHETGVVSYPTGASVYEVVERIKAAHALASPDCVLDLSRVRVFPLSPTPDRS